MKILHVITSLRLGGAEKLVAELLPRLRQAGHEVAVYVFLGIHTPLVNQLREAGIHVIMGPKNRSVYYPGHIRVLRRLMPNYDIVHTHNSSSQLFAALAHIGRTTPLVTTEHSTYNRRRQHAFFRPLDRWMYRQYRQIICISELCLQNLQTYLADGKTSSMCVIHNGIDIELYSSAQPSAEYNHETLHAAHLLINVAGFRQEKDQPTLIRAMRLLPDDYHLLLVGEGECLPTCQQLAQSLGVAQRVHFLGLRTDIPSLLQSADVVLMSSHYEGLSLSCLEGMSAGKPLVASDVDGLREVVSGYGVLFPHEDEKALAAAVERLCTDTANAASIAKRCRQRALQFDIRQTTEGYTSVYQSIIAPVK